MKRYILIIVIMVGILTGLKAQSPLCSSYPTTFCCEYVSSVTINGVTKAGAPDATGFTSGPGYFDYTSSSLTTLTAGQTYPVSVVVKTNSSYQEFVKIWFDFNGNGVLNDAGELVFDQVNTFNGTYTYSGNITVPADAFNGDVYIRVVMVYANSPALCGSYSYGTTLDFKATITGGLTSRNLNVTTTSSGGYSGSVSSSPSGINTGSGLNSANFPNGSDVVLTATASGGGMFQYWSGDATGATNPLTVQMNSNMNIVANFGPPYTVPTLTTASATSVTGTSATSGGNVTNSGNKTVTSRGICWNTSPNPTTANSHTTDGSGTGSFTSSLTGLTPGTLYYVRAYAVNEIGTGYGNQITFGTVPTDPASASANPSTIYVGSSTQLSVTGAQGTVQWYTESCGGTPVGTGNPLTVSPTATTTYYARNYANSVYSTGCSSVTVTVNKYDQTITFSSIPGKTYGDADFSPATSSSELTVSYSSSNESVATIVAGKIHISGVGSAEITATQAGNATYNPATPVVQTLTVSKASLTVTGASVTSKTYDGSTTATISGATLSGKIGSDDVSLGNSITGTFNDANVGTGKTVTTAMTISGTAAGNYNLTQPTLTGNITAKSVTLTGVTAASKVYDGTTTATLSGGIANTVVGTETLTITAGTGTFADKNVGTKAVTASGYSLADGTNGGLASNYYLSAQPVVPDQSITAKAVTITDVTASSKIYDGTTTASLTGGSVNTGIGSETLTIVEGTGTFADKNVGTKAVTASGYSLADGTNGGLASNYSLSAQPVVPDQSITAKAVTITGVTALSKVYDGTTTASLTGGSVNTGIGSETLTIVEGTGTFADKNVGTKSVTASGYSLGDGNNGGLASNYVLSAQPLVANQSITAKIVTITGITAASKVYDGTTDAILSGGSVENVVGSETLAIIEGSGTFADKNVGTWAVTATGYSIDDGINGGFASNYTLSSQPVIPNQSITEKSIAVTADTETKVYGEDDPALTYSFTPALISGDSFTGSLSRTAGENVGTYSINQNNLSLSSNYTLNYTSADLSITAKPVTVTAEAKTKVYGDTDPDFTYTFSPALISGDYFTGSLSRTPGENVGDYSINQNDLTLSSNYTLNYNSSDLSITAKPVTVTAEAKTKVYGDTDPDFTYTFSPALISGDYFTGSLSRTAGENVGTYSINQNDLNLSSNYALNYSSSDLTITAKPVSVTAEAKMKVYGDDDPALTYTFTPALVPGDSFSGSLSRTEGENVGTFSINLNDLALSSNYTMNYTSADLSIIAKSIAVSAEAKTKVYGTSDPALTYTFTPSLVLGDSFSGSLSRSAGENTGTYTINRNDLALSSNYAMTYTPAELTVNKATLTVTADSKEKVYGSANPSLSFHYEGFIAGEDESVLDTKPQASTIITVNSEAGLHTGAITVTGGVDNNYQFNYLPADFNIRKAELNALAESKTKVYGESNPQLTISYSGFVNGDDSNEIDVPPAISTDAVTSSQVGTYPVILSPGSDNNYLIKLINGSLTVTKASLTATADNKSKTFSQANPELTVSYSGFVNGDDAESLDVPPVPSTNATISSDAGNYPVILSSGSDNNYEISTVDGNLTVNKAVLKVTADDKTKTYGQPNPQLTLTYSGFVNGDDLNDINTKPTATTTAVLASDAGVYDIVLEGGSDNNYSFSLQNGKFDIIKADQNITFLPIHSGLRASEKEQLFATTTSGLPISFESSSYDIADINGNFLSVLREGTVTISASQVGNNNFNAATPVAQTIKTLPTFDNVRSLFTPNNDGMNDYWYIPDAEQYGTMHIQIYNRFGKLVYESSAYKNDWDGTCEGKPLPEASYYYIIKSGNLGIIKGVVNIVR